MVEHGRRRQAHAASFKRVARRVDPCGQTLRVCYQPGDEH